MVGSHDIMPNIQITRVFTFGWSPEFVIRPLMGEGVGEDEVVLLVSAKPESEYARRKVENAYQEVKKFANLAGVMRLEYREIDISKDFEEICRDFIWIISEFRPARGYRFYLTGGMRVLIAAGLIAAGLLSQVYDLVAFVSHEDAPTLYRIPVQTFRLDLRGISEARLDILRILKGVGEASFEDLAVGRDEVTVRKLLTKLRGMGLVVYRSVGRRQLYRLTPLGEAVLYILGR
jgi:CRISPR locus-related DNA-binding protein